MGRAPDALVGIRCEIEEHQVEDCARHLAQFVLTLDQREVIDVQQRSDDNGKVRIGVPLVEAKAPALAQPFGDIRERLVIMEDAVLPAVRELVNRE